MIPPALVQAVAHKLCQDTGATGVAILILRDRGGCELISAQDTKRMIPDFPALLRKMADQVEDGRPDEGLADDRGIHRPGDVFKVTAHSQPGWIGVLVQARCVEAWGVIADAIVPTGLEVPAIFPVRLGWNQIQFIGRPGMSNAPSKPSEVPI